MRPLCAYTLVWRNLSDMRSSCGCTSFLPLPVPCLTRKSTSCISSKWRPSNAKILFRWLYEHEKLPHEKSESQVQGYNTAPKDQKSIHAWKLVPQTSGIAEQWRHESFALGLSKNAPVLFGYLASRDQRFTRSRPSTWHMPPAWTDLEGQSEGGQRALHMARQGCPFTKGPRQEEMALFWNESRIQLDLDNGWCQE